MTDIQPDEFLAAVWLRGKEFPHAKEHLDTILTPETSTGIQSRKIHETLNSPDIMLRVGLRD